MTTTHVGAAGSSGTWPRRRTIRRDPFFAAMSAAILFLVLAGFTPTLYLRQVFKPAPIPGYLFVHGILLTSWFVWFFVQSVLIRSGRIALHRRLGVAGGVLAAVVPFAGLLATSGVVGHVAALGIDIEGDASAFGIGVNGSAVQFLAGVIWGNIGSAVSFAALVWTGIALRRRTGAHKRLMLIATVTILGPALARLARLPFFGGEQGPFTLIVLLALLVAVVVHDAVAMKKLHPATIWGIALAIGVNGVCTAIAGTTTGLNLVRWLR